MAGITLMGSRYHIANILKILIHCMHEPIFFKLFKKQQWQAREFSTLLPAIKKSIFSIYGLRWYHLTADFTVEALHHAIQVLVQSHLCLYAENLLHTKGW